MPVRPAGTSIWCLLSSPTAYSGPVGWGVPVSGEVGVGGGVESGAGIAVAVGVALACAEPVGPREVALGMPLDPPQPATTNATVTTTASARCGRMARCSSPPDPRTMAANHPRTGLDSHAPVHPQTSPGGLDNRTDVLYPPIGRRRR